MEEENRTVDLGVGDLKRLVVVVVVIVVLVVGSVLIVLVGLVFRLRCLANAVYAIVRIERCGSSVRSLLGRSTNGVPSALADLDTRCQQPHVVCTGKGSAEAQCPQRSEHAVPMVRPWPCIGFRPKEWICFAVW